MPPGFYDWVDEIFAPFAVDMLLERIAKLSARNRGLRLQPPAKRTRSRMSETG
jgi:hypothetical protein